MLHGVALGVWLAPILLLVLLLWIAIGSMVGSIRAVS